MKKNAISLCFILPLVLNAVGPSADEMALYKARRDGAQASESLRVVDQDGVPVPGANIWGGLQTGDGPNDFIPIRGMTDATGKYVIRGKCTNRIRCDITKDGYYDSEFLATSYAYTHTISAGKWQPYGKSTTIVLKKIKNPVAKGLRYIDRKIPSYGLWIGYDFETADWIQPWGKGDHSDAMVRFTAREVGRFDFGYKMELSFAHSKFAGAVRRKKDTSSRFPSIYNAMTNDEYKSVIVFEVDRKGARKDVWDQLENDEYLVFRVRTKVNDKGELVSAHYGRIDGEWKFYELHGMWIRGLYFNIVPNDTNLEDMYSLEDTMQRKRKRKETKR